MKKVVDKLNKIDKHIPDEPLYKALVLLLILANLATLAYVVYSQNNPEIVYRTVTLSRHYVDEDPAVCMEKCSSSATVRDESVVEEVESAGNYVDGERGFSFEYEDGVTVNVESETGVLAVDYGDSSDLVVSMTFIGADSSPIPEWVEVNYPEQDLVMLESKVMESDAYSIDEYEGRRLLFLTLGSEIVEVSYEYGDLDKVETDARVESLLSSMKRLGVE